MINISIFLTMSPEYNLKERVKYERAEEKNYNKAIETKLRI